MPTPLSRSLRICCATLLLLLTAPRASHADDWVRVVSDHFETVGNVTDYEARKIAQMLEHFHEVLVSSVLRGGESAIRPVVLVFKNNLTFEPYMPDRSAKVAIGGMFFFGDESLLALNASNLDYAMQTTLTGYTQLALANAVGTVPLWLSLGMGQVYETFQESNGGKGAILGTPERTTVGVLRSATWIPLQTLLDLDARAPAVSVGNPQRAAVDAQCWALVHYLSFGARSGQFSRFVADLRGGVDEDTAFKAAFGDLAVLERELVDYVRKVSFPALQIVYDEKIKPAMPAKGEKLTAADAESYLATLLVRTGHIDQARTRLTKATETTPPSALAAAALADLEFASGNGVRGMELLARAAASAPTNPRVAGRLGHRLTESLMRQTDRSAADIERARGVLRPVVEADSTNHVAAAELGWLLNLDPPDRAAAIPLLTQAAARAPRREAYRLWLAEALARERRFDEARNQLGPLLSRGTTPDVRDSARRMLGAMSAVQNGSGNRTTSPSPASAPGSTTAATAGSTPTAAAATSAPLARPGTELPPGTGKPVPYLRRPAADETRVLGIFTAMECDATGMRLVIQSESGPLKLVAGKPGDIEFLSYRQDSPGQIGCGPIQPAQRVVATYRAAENRGTAGVAVAIELLPDDYTPQF